MSALKTISAMAGKMERLEAENARLKEELAAAQKDAERYRWIMNNQDMVRHALEFGDTTKENADAAIDAAIAAEKGEKK